MEFPAVSFLFTDIEGSTRLWEQYPEAMSVALARHDALSREAVEGHGGAVVKTSGDGVHAAFADPVDALLAAVAIQRALAREQGTVRIRVRCAVHFGPAEKRSGDYYGPVVNRAARLADSANAGQVLATAAVRDGVRGRLPEGLSLRELGETRLRDLSTAEPVFQLVHPELQEDFPPLRSLATTPNNLPHLLTPLVGRRAEVRAVRGLLDHTRLVTVSGVGGIGKTRLALQAAAHRLDQHPDGVWLVELSALSDPALVDAAAARALGVKEARGCTMRESLAEQLRERRVLLVLDTCEHLVDACAALADALLRAAPHLRILATSRVTLDIEGEAVYPVPALPIPDPDFPSGLQQLREVDSVRLFLERAALRHPGFEVSEAEAPVLARVVYRLDGIPLAIELAAARLATHGVADLEAGLADRFGLLAVGSRVAPPRQKTLRGMLDWSVQLLSPPARQAYERLSVFAGGWSPEGAQAVAGTGPEAMEELRRSSLLVQTGEGPAARQRFLDTVREHARAGLEARGEAEEAREAHAAWFIRLAGQFQERAVVASAERLTALDADHDNARAALDWLLRPGADPEAALALVARLRDFFHARGHLREGLAWTTRALDHPAPPALTHARARARLTQAAFLYALGELERSYEASREALAGMVELGRPGDVVDAMLGMAHPTFVLRGHEASRGLYEDAIARLEALGRPALAAHHLVNLANNALYAGDVAYGRSRLAQAEALLARDPNPMSAVMVHSARANFLVHEGDAAGAAAESRRAIAICEERGEVSRAANERFRLARALVHAGDFERSRHEHRAALAALRPTAQGIEIVNAAESASLLLASDREGAKALALLGAADALRERIGFPVGAQARQVREAARDRAGSAAALPVPPVATAEQLATFALEQLG